MLHGRVRTGAAGDGAVTWKGSGTRAPAPANESAVTGTPVTWAVTHPDSGYDRWVCDGSDKLRLIGKDRDSVF